MKIYFSGSIAGGRDKKEDYIKIIEVCKSFGEVLTEHVGDENALKKTDKVRFSENEAEHVYLRDKNWLDEADVVIADISVPSIGVGYEIAYAEANGKRIFCLYDKNSSKRPSMMITGNGRILYMEYENIEDAIYRCVKPFLADCVGIFE